MNEKLIITESTKEQIKKDFKKIDFDNVDELLEILKESKKYNVSYVGGKIKIRQVLNG